MTRKKMATAKGRPTRAAVRATSNSKTQQQLFHLWSRTSELVQRLMVTLEEGIATPHALPEHWERIFGAKDSAVVNLQKLVAVLTLISERLHMLAPEEERAQGPIDAMQEDDLEMVMRWAERELAALRTNAE